MTDQSITNYEKAYDSAIWNRKRAVQDARETLHARAKEKGLLILDDSLTFTVQAVSVPPVQHAFGERPGYLYWIIRAVAGVVVPA